MLDKELLSKCAKRGLPKELFWTQSKHLAGAALQAMNTGSVDGIMFIQSFGCGPDATITPLLAREAKKAKMPYRYSGAFLGVSHIFYKNLYTRTKNIQSRKKYLYVRLLTEVWPPFWKALTR